MAMQQPMSAPASDAPKLTITPKTLQAKMHLSPQQTQQLQRIVIAGMKVMFSPQTRGLLQKALAGDGPIAQKIGLGVAGLLGILMQESQNSIPRQLLVPAGMLLVVHAVEFLDKSGAGAGDQDVSQAIQVMTQAILHAHGVDSNKLAAIGASGKIPQAPQGPGAAAPAGGPPPAPGLIGGAMQGA
jgi:hypothetical protein